MKENKSSSSSNRGNTLMSDEIVSAKNSNVSSINRKDSGDSEYLKKTRIFNLTIIIVFIVCLLVVLLVNYLMYKHFVKISTQKIDAPAAGAQTINKTSNEEFNANWHPKMRTRVI